MANEDRSSAPLNGQNADQIHDRMAERRASITSRIELLEYRVEDRIIQTVDKIATDIENTFGRIADSVSRSVEHSVDELQTAVVRGSEHVQEGLQKGVSNLSGKLDFNRQFSANPVTMFGASIFAGFILGEILRTDSDSADRNTMSREEPLVDNRVEAPVATTHAGEPNHLYAGI